MAKKIKLPQKIFSQKQLIKFPCTYQPFYSAKFLKSSLSLSRVVRMCHFWTQNGPFVLNKSFFGTNHHYYFHLPIRPIHWEKFKKFLGQIQSYENVPSLGPKWSICLPPPPNFFFLFFLEGGIVNIILISSIYQPLSLCKFKKKEL